MKTIRLGKHTLILDSDIYEIVKTRKLGIYGRKKHWYARVSIENNWIPIHKFVCPSPKGFYTDHINHNTFDNRRENLRIVTPTENSGNRMKLNDGTEVHTSKYRGVRKRQDSKPHHRAWMAAIKKGPYRYHLGSFYTEEDAARAYDEKAKELFGEFAHLNFAGE